jgi:hypothetical protein
MRELDALIRQHNAEQETAQFLACLSGGLAASAAYNAAGATKEDGTRFTVADFLPGQHEQHEQRQTPEQMLQIVELLTDAYGGKRIVN